MRLFLTKNLHKMLIFNYLTLKNRRVSLPSIPAQFLPVKVPLRVSIFENRRGLCGARLSFY
ncbi:MAG: hypothetical protein D6714_05900, partial [Bacteroidetes bacterium]